MTSKKINNSHRQNGPCGHADAPPSPGALRRIPQPPEFKYEQYGAFLEFDENGNPVSKYRQPPPGLITKQEAHNITLQIMSMPFQGRVFNPVTREWEELDLPEMHGRPMKEVMDFMQASRAAMGDLASYKELNDRAYGKPIQESHNVNVDATQTYEDFLKKLEADEQQNTPQQNQYEPSIDEPSIDELLEDF